MEGHGSAAEFEDMVLVIAELKSHNRRALQGGSGF